MKIILFFFLLVTLSIDLLGQDDEKNSFLVELTYGYDLSTKDRYRRKIISTGENGAIGIIHNLRLGANIGYPIRPNLYLLTGVKTNMNSIPHAGTIEDNIFTKIFFTRKYQRDFYIIIPLRVRFYVAITESRKWFYEGGFSFYHYITSYRKFEKEFKKDEDYVAQKYSLNFSMGREWNKKNNRKIAFQIIVRFQLNESLNSNLPNLNPRPPSHRYDHIGFEMRHSF